MFALYKTGSSNMATLNLEQEIPLDDSWDVVVLGGGPAGSAAPIRRVH